MRSRASAEQRVRRAPISCLSHRDPSIRERHPPRRRAPAAPVSSAPASARAPARSRATPSSNSASASSRSTSSASSRRTISSSRRRSSARRPRRDLGHQFSSTRGGDFAVGDAQPERQRRGEFGARGAAPGRPRSGDGEAALEDPQRAQASSWAPSRSSRCRCGRSSSRAIAATAAGRRCAPAARPRAASGAPGPPASRSARSSTRRARSRWSGTASSAAAEGVGARTSATRSRERDVGLMPDSGDGRDLHRGERAADRFAVEGGEVLLAAAAPAHDADVDAVQPIDQFAARAPVRARASAPCTLAPTTRIRTRAASGFRATVMMSRSAAPSRLVTTAMRARDTRGSGRFRAGSNRPSLVQRRLDLLAARCCCRPSRSVGAASVAREAGIRPCSSQMVGVPKTKTSAPSAGGRRTAARRVRHITQRTWRSASGG